jgi:hypothetical protein
MKKAELIKGKPLTLSAEIICGFRAPDAAEPARRPWEVKPLIPSTRKTYTEIYLKDGMESLLVINPKIDAPAGVKVKILSLTPRKIKAKEFSHQEYDHTERGYRKQTTYYKPYYYTYDNGYAIRCEVELTTAEGFTPGEQAVTVSLPQIETVAKLIGAKPMGKTPEYRFELIGWESEAARLAALAKIENEKRFKVYRVIGIILGSILGLTVVCKFLGRLSRKSEQRRLQKIARCRIVVQPSGTASRMEPFKHTIAREESELDQAPPTLVQSRKAKDSCGREADVSLSCEGRPVSWTNQEWKRPIEIGGYVHYLPFHTAEVEYQMQLTASVGRRARPGKYLADSPLGLVLIEVSDMAGDSEG